MIPTDRPPSRLRRRALTLGILAGIVGLVGALRSRKLDAAEARFHARYG